MSGGYKTPEYRAWSDMRQRCLNSKNLAFKNYGGRGIVVCERWADFACFLADMGARPDGMSLDRIDNDGPYAPANCRWATRGEQRQSQRNTRYIEHNGERKMLLDWATERGMDSRTLSRRLRMGMTFADALNTPVDPIRSRQGTIRAKARWSRA